MNFIHNNFLGLDNEGIHSFDSANIHFLQAGYEGTASYEKGTGKGPAAIIEASKQLESFDLRLKKDLSEQGIHTVPPLELPVWAELAIKVVAQSVQNSMPRFPFLLGGEHTVTLGAVHALHRMRHYDSVGNPDFGILQIDAHLDLRKSYQGETLHHATVGYQLRYAGFKVFPVGIRVCSQEEHAYIEAHEDEIISWGDDEASWPSILAALPKKVYVTVDVDGLDPSWMPATGTPVPGGLSWKQINNLLREVGTAKQVIGCDITEFSPVATNHAPSYAAAQLAYNMIGYFRP